MPAKKETTPAPAPKKGASKKAPVEKVEAVLPPSIPDPVSEPAPALEMPAVSVSPSAETALPMAPIPEESLSPGDERTWAMLAHLSVFLNLVTGFLGPIAALIIYLVFKERSRYVAYHAIQSFISQMIWWVGGVMLATVTWAAGTALAVVLVGFLLMPLACLFTLMPMVALVYGIVGGVQTSQGQDFKYWLIGDWTRRTLTG